MAGLAGRNLEQSWHEDFQGSQNMKYEDLMKENKKICKENNELRKENNELREQLKGSQNMDYMDLMKENNELREQLKKNSVEKQNEDTKDAVVRSTRFREPSYISSGNPSSTEVTSGRFQAPSTQHVAQVRPSTQHVAQVRGIEIPHNSMATLDGEEWLDDKIVNSYFKLIAIRSQESSSKLKVLSMPTYFLQQFKNRKYDGIKKWIKQTSLFEEMDLMFIPLNNKNHWVLIVVDFRGIMVKNWPWSMKNEIPVYYYCSLGGYDEEPLRSVRDFLEEHEKTLKLPEKKKYTMQTPKDYPKQSNGWDCGVFICQYAEILSRDEPLNVWINQDMQNIRETMKTEISNGKLSIPGDGEVQTVKQDTQDKPQTSKSTQIRNPSDGEVQTVKQDTPDKPQTSKLTQIRNPSYGEGQTVKQDTQDKPQIRNPYPNFLRIFGASKNSDGIYEKGLFRSKEENNGKPIYEHKTNEKWIFWNGNQWCIQDNKYILFRSGTSYLVGRWENGIEVSEI